MSISATVNTKQNKLYSEVGTKKEKKHINLINYKFLMFVAMLAYLVSFYFTACLFTSCSTELKGFIVFFIMAFVVDAGKGFSFFAGFTKDPDVTGLIKFISRCLGTLLLFMSIFATVFSLVNQTNEMINENSKESNSALDRRIAIVERSIQQYENDVNTNWGNKIKELGKEIHELEKQKTRKNTRGLIPFFEMITGKNGQAFANETEFLNFLVVFFLSTLFEITAIYLTILASIKAPIKNQKESSDKSSEKIIDLVSEKQKKTQVEKVSEKPRQATGHKDEQQIEKKELVSENEKKKELIKEKKEATKEKKLPAQKLIDKYEKTAKKDQEKNGEVRGYRKMASDVLKTTEYQAKKVFNYLQTLGKLQTNGAKTFYVGD